MLEILNECIEMAKHNVFCYSNNQKELKTAKNNLKNLEQIQRIIRYLLKNYNKFDNFCKYLDDYDSVPFEEERIMLHNLLDLVDGQELDIL